MTKKAGVSLRPGTLFAARTLRREGIDMNETERKSAQASHAGKRVVRHQESTMAQLSRWATEWTGSSAAFGLAVLTILIWMISGPIFGYCDTWQLVINTGTTIVTFLMVFLIQRAQNKDSRAIHLKLNELVAAIQGASNRLINIEGLTEEEINTLQTHFCTLVELARADENLGKSHSIEEAAARHKHKKRQAT
jgi:low affinity Fe/Cu permease